MKIRKIELKELFGNYNYDIRINDKEMITILHAPNGYGKTTLLKLIKSVIEGDILLLDEIPFKEISIKLDNGQKISVIKNDAFDSFIGRDVNAVKNEFIKEKEGIKLPFYYEFSRGSVIRNFDIKVDSDAMMRIIRILDLRYQNKRISTDSKAVTVMDAMKSLDLENEIFNMDELINLLMDYRKHLHIHMIGANRLFTFESAEDGTGRMVPKTVETIRMYSNELKGLLLKVRESFAGRSEQLDRTFPNRVLELVINGGEKEILTEDDIRKELEHLENRRRELESLGILDPSDATMLPEKLNISLDMRKFFTLYIQDNKKKLKEFKSIEDKIRLLLDVINSRNRFSNKKLIIDRENGIVFTLSNGRNVPAEKLSSGEKNEFILFYELIFKCHKNSIVLIDEPEISLHIAWQQEFIKQLKNICRINEMQAVVATHSPDIVDDNWDLMVDLEGM